MGLFKRKEKNRLQVTVKQNGDVQVTGTTTDDELSTEFARLQIALADFVIKENNLSVDQYIQILKHSLEQARGENDEQI